MSLRMTYAMHVFFESFVSNQKRFEFWLGARLTPATTRYSAQNDTGKNRTTREHWVAFLTRSITMTPLLTPLALSLIALLLIDGTSAWHTERRDYNMLAFGHSRRAPVATTKRETSTTTSSRRKGAHVVDESQSRSWRIHTTRSSHTAEYSHTVDVSSKSTPRNSKHQETSSPFVQGDGGNTSEEENEMELFAATDMTACMSDFGCF